MDGCPRRADEIVGCARGQTGDQLNNTMFDLETALSTWRHAMKQNRVILSDDLDELESHIQNGKLT